MMRDTNEQKNDYETIISTRAKKMMTTSKKKIILFS